MSWLLVVAICLLCTLHSSNAQDDYAEGMEPDPEYEGHHAQEDNDVQFQTLNEGHEGYREPKDHKIHGDYKGHGEEGQYGKDEYHEEGNDQWSKELEPDDDDSHVAEMMQPYINRGPPTRGETYKIAATMYTHLWIRRNKSLQTKRTKATVTPTVLWDQYFLRNRLKSKIKVHHVKAHYRREYRARLAKMVNQGVGGIILNRTHDSWDELMDEYRPFREEQMIKADDRMFNKFIRRMDTVLQSGRYEKWRFHQNTTHKPRFDNEKNLLFTDRIDKKMIMEIRSLARSLRKDVHKYFDILDNQFLRTYFRIPYNISLYYQYPQPLNYTEQF